MYLQQATTTTTISLNDVHVLLVSDCLWRRSRWLAAVQQGHTRGYCSPTSTIRHWVFYLVCMHCRCPAERHGYFIPALACREAWLFILVTPKLHSVMEGKPLVTTPVADHLWSGPRPAVRCFGPAKCSEVSEAGLGWARPKATRGHTQEPQSPV